MSNADAKDELTMPAAARLVVPHFSQWLGVWAMADEHFAGLLAAVQSLDVFRHLQSEHAALTRRGSGSVNAYSQNGIGVIELNGTLMKHASSLGQSTSTVEARRAIRDMAADDDIRGIMLHIDSPGGTVAGTKELASEVARASVAKPTKAFISDLGASAAYWVASQASEVIANEMALVGSIGTYGVVHDYSAAAAKDGVKVHVVRAGASKGAFTPGTEVTGDQLKEYQRIIDSLNAHFLQAVSEGRKLDAETVATLADGRVHPASQAKAFGLIDSVSDFDTAMARFYESVTPKKSKGIKMSEEQKPQPATLAELKAAMPMADATFILSQLEKDATLQSALTAFAAKQQAEIEEAKQATAKLAEENAKLASGKTGVDPLPSGNSNPTPADAIVAWEEVVADTMKAKGCDKQRATMIAAKEHPELRQAMIEAYNQKNGRG